jgi:two-component system, response regulator
MPENDDLRILVAEDDEDDQLLLREALRVLDVKCPVDFVPDGEALLARLRQDTPPQTALVVLDLNMPRMNGHEVLQAIRADDALLHIPVVFLTTSNRPEDVLRSYRLGANAFMTKPTTYEDFVKLMRQVCAYWLGAVQLPRQN